MDANYVNAEKSVPVVSRSTQRPVYHFIKRVMDVSCSLLALIILSPVLLITAIAIFIDDPGPVLFKQTRIGKDCKPFRIFKFSLNKMTAEGFIGL